MKNSFWLLGPLLFCVYTVHAQQQRSTNGRVATDPLQAEVTLHNVQQDVEIAETLQNLKKDAAHGLLAFRNVRVVDPVTESVSSNRTVIVADDRIVWVGDRKEEPAEAREATEIDGTALYMSPGLADMQVHSSSAGA